jgi:hypothetical protein
MSGEKNLTMTRNQTPQLKRVNETLYVLDFDTNDERGGLLMAHTHIEGTLVAIILKMVLAYRRAMQLARRNERKLLKQQAAVQGGAAELIKQSTV